MNRHTTLAGLLMIAGLLVLASSYTVIAAGVNATNETSNMHIADFLTTALTNEKVLIAVTIQFLLGLGLGYYSAKVIKYLLALIGIVILGAVLSVWSLGGSIDDFLLKLGTQAHALMPVIEGFMATLGILTVGPVTVGFLLGLLIAISRK
jgi:uncharacterized membrane protein (Fun14 family)